MKSEISERADFSGIRYAQCWEDADVLVEALDPKPEHACISIASAGDNTLALVARGPRKVIALDLSAAQLACLALRVAAFRVLTHRELLELLGVRGCENRLALYERCRRAMGRQELRYWDERKTLIERGVAHAGKFERYFELFRRRVLPLMHGRKTVEQLLTRRTPEEREEFYERTWNTFRWRAMFRIFFSRWVMGRAGRDPEFFRYVEGSVADRILERTRYALVNLDPEDNPYLQWILCGTFRMTLPFALREENFESVRKNLGCLEWRRQSLGELLNEKGEDKFDRFNLSDIFEYMPRESFESLLESIAARSNTGARLAYWNMLTPRSRPDSLKTRIASMPDRSRELFQKDKAWFYSAFVLEEIV
ncbi:MAG: DUF3419 family protein [Acidobacteriaceae bacterium]|nr:DUF3419 family protein [Acidobacteriaceae bacterium]